MDSLLEVEQEHQEELVKERLENIRLHTQIRRLEEDLRDWEDNRDPLQVQFEQLQVQRLEQKKQAEKEKERSLKLQQKTCSSLEVGPGARGGVTARGLTNTCPAQVLSNMKEKISSSQTHVQLRREELARLEAQEARRREVLLRTQQAFISLHQDSSLLREDWGLLGHRTLLHDLETTLDSTQAMEQHLEELKEQLRGPREDRGQRWGGEEEREESAS